MKFLIANWKANLNFTNVSDFCQNWLQLLKEKPLPIDLEVVVATTSLFYTWLEQEDRHFSVGLQDISVFHGGAYTGEVTITNLADNPPKYVIIGHSERRQYFQETNQLILQKAQRLWEVGSIPVICFDLPVLSELSELLSDYFHQEMIFAFEPVSAISTSGKAGNLSPQELQQLMPKFRATFQGKPVIYGGSVKPDNAAGYANLTAGLLIGNASLQAESYYQIINAFSNY
jgi:triosephosphate isomerase